MVQGFLRRLGELVRGPRTPARARGLRTPPATPSPAPRPRPTPPAPKGSAARPPQGSPAGYPGDFQGRPPIEYAPTPADRPDPGEVVWAWVAYEEDHTRGKDRPVLVIGRDDPWLLALPLTSKDHDRDEAQEARAGRFWIDIGSGAWDSQGRASEARTDRVIRVDPQAVRGRGVALDRVVFEAVAAEVRRRTA